MLILDREGFQLNALTGDFRDFLANYLECLWVQSSGEQDKQEPALTSLEIYGRRFDWQWQI